MNYFILFFLSSASVPSSPVTSPSVTSPTAGSPASPTNNGNIPPGSITPTMPIGMPSATPLNTGREINPLLINPLTAPSVSSFSGQGVD